MVVMTVDEAWVAMRMIVIVRVLVLVRLLGHHE